MWILLNCLLFKNVALSHLLPPFRCYPDVTFHFSFSHRTMFIYNFTKINSVSRHLTSRLVIYKRSKMERRLFYVNIFYVNEGFTFKISELSQDSIIFGPANVWSLSILAPVVILVGWSIYWICWYVSVMNFIIKCSAMWSCVCDKRLQLVLRDHFR